MKIMRITIAGALLLSLLFISVAAQSAGKKKCELLKKSGQAVVGGEAPFFGGWYFEQRQKVFNTNKIWGNPGEKRIALVFFTTTCGPCLVGMEKLKKARKKLKKAKVPVFLVNFKEDAKKVERFMKKHSMPFPVIHDRFGNAQGSYLDSSGKSVVLPRTVILGKDGKVKLIIGEEGDDYVDCMIERNG
jgi:peroxiredoxin